MKISRVCVIYNSPAWKHYVQQGWVELWAEGRWVTLVRPAQFGYSG